MIQRVVDSVQQTVNSLLSVGSGFVNTISNVTNGNEAYYASGFLAMLIVIIGAVLLVVKGNMFGE